MSEEEQKPLVNEKVEDRKDTRRESVSWLTLIGINVPWFAIYFHATILSSILIPYQVEKYTGNSAKGKGFGIVNVFASIAGSVMAPTVGSLSDRTNTRIGRRKPWIVFGMLLNCCIGMMLSFSPNLIVFTAAMTLDVIGVYGPLSSLIPDLIPEQQRGVASGLQQLFQNVGAVAGSILGLFGTDLGTIPKAWQFNTYVVEIGVMLLTVPVILIVFKEQVQETKKHSKAFSCKRVARKLRPFLSRNFLILCTAGMFVIGFGNTVIQSYYQYYAQDTLSLPLLAFKRWKVENSEQAAALFILSSLIGSALAAYPAGKLADVMSRKLLITISILLQTVAPVGLCLTRSFELDLVYGFVYGVGYVSFTAVSFSILSDMLGKNPESGDSETALGTGLYYFVQFFPSSFTPIMYGYIIDHFHKINKPMLGYWILYGQIGGGFVLAMILIWALKRDKVIKLEGGKQKKIYGSIQHPQDSTRDFA